MPRSDKVSAADHAKLKSFLQENKIPVGQLVTAIGASPSGRTKKQLSDDLKRFIRTRKKGQ